MRSLRPIAALSGLVALMALSGCEQLRLLPLYFQEKQYVEDRELVAKIKGAMLAAPELQGTAIEVDAYLKDVTLRGSAQSRDQAARAVEIAKSVDGAKLVTDSVTVQTAQGRLAQ
jgi:osmotically-inducible protein OsmY